MRSHDNRPGRSALRIAACGLAVVVVGALAVGGGWLLYHRTAFDRAMAAVWRAGYTERDADVDGARVHYAEGPANGRPPLLLIHGQTGDWKSYAAVLPDLAQDYHVFVVDCFGHGASAHDPVLYSATAHGEALARFLDRVVGEPAVVSGHSSGGVLAAWLAGHAPERVRAVVLEDPPLFTTQLPRARTTWNYVDLATACHGFLTSGATDWIAYSWEHQRMWKFFGDGARGLIDAGLDYHARHPGEPIRIWFVPQFDEVNRSMPAYDPRFGEAFYTGTWDAGFDLEATLRAIRAPAALIHTKVAYDTDGVLMAAMGDEEASRARSLIRGVEFEKAETGHGFHMEDPRRFVEIARRLGR
ncbi:alpha/beta fold hydrolase [Nigerium massiliense]|uniref:alpha/beta fold hydrolase n=1 Tax=Nigerium massiliense TaxID=1522317 RepID=UPI0006937640|nr:alpha/beta hydrolase [Nigerium massiliense]